MRSVSRILGTQKTPCSFCIWEDDSSLQSKKTFCSVVLFPRVVYGGPIEALNHQSAITIFGPGTLSLKASLG